MSFLLASVKDSTEVTAHYIDRRLVSQLGDAKKFEEVTTDALQHSTTLYIGNLSHWTTEPQLWAVLSRYGRLSDVVMGINREDRTPCGFCLATYTTRSDAETAHQCLQGAIIDDRVVRADFDRGGDLRAEGRHWGRAWTGGQVIDDYRQNIDAGRGGVNGRQRWEAKAKDAEAVDVVEEARPVYHWLTFHVGQWRNDAKRPR